MEEPTSEEEVGITTVSKSPKRIKPQNLNSDQNPNPNSDNFSSLGLSDWTIKTCKNLNILNPTPVQTHCIPKIISGQDILALSQTGTGKTTAFALPILHHLAEDPYGVFALIITPTRELASHLAEQFKSLGSGLSLRCCVIVEGMDMLTQTRSLVSRPHIVITTPGRIKVLLEKSPEIPPVFSRTKFLVLDEADRVLEDGFQDELRTIFQCLPENRQTLLFSTTMTSNLETLYEQSSNNAYFYEANNEGLKTASALDPDEDLLNIPVEVLTEENNIDDVILKSRKLSPRVTQESGGELVDVPVTVSTNVANSTSKKGNRKRKLESILLEDENVGEDTTRRRSLRNKGETRKHVIEETDEDDDEYLYSDKDDEDDVNDEKDYVHDIESYYPETEMKDANDGSIENLVASWKRCITGVGQAFQSVVEFRDALQKYAVACRFGYRLRKNESNRACGVCLVNGCPWKIYASWVPSDNLFRIKKFNRKHTCDGESWKSAHPKKNWVVSIIKERLNENPNQKTKNIADSILKDFGIELSYCTIRRGIDEARGGLHTSFKDAYKHLPYFVDKVVEANPGSLVNLFVGEDKRFQRLFMSLRACVNGFQTGCRPLLFLDAIPFKSKYHEVLLTASALDGDDGVVPVGLALVDVETDETWRWFLEQLKLALSSEERSLTFVSDREKGLMSCVLEVFENARHGYSIHYLMEDFMRSLKAPFLGDGKPSLSYHLLAAARADRVDGFKVYTEQIKRVSSRAYDWVMEIEGKHWANAFFEGEPYSHVTSDVGEIYSKWIDEIHETSIITKLVAFVGKIVELVNGRHMKSKEWFSQLVPSKEECLMEECNKASMLKVFLCSDTSFEVHGGGCVQLVDMSNHTCSCYGWKPTGLPCQHAIAVLNMKGGNVYEYCSGVLTVESYRCTYSEGLGGVEVDLDLVENEVKEEEQQVLPPLFSRVNGVDKRIKDRKRGRSVCCTKCGGVGHNKATCKDD